MPVENPYAGSQESLVVALARKGDRDAFGELVRRRQRWLRTLMYRCCGDQALADDLAQQAFLQAFKSLEQLRDTGRFGPWIKRLAINGWLQTLRKRDALEVAETWTESVAAPASPELARDLHSALDTLPEPVRLCIVLSYNEGMTHAEIVEATGFPAGTVKSHIRRGGARLRELLAAYAEPAHPPPSSSENEPGGGS